MVIINWLIGRKASLGVLKSILLRQQLLNKKYNNALKARFKTFVAIASLLLTVVLRLKKTNAKYVIFDNFIAPQQEHLRTDFVDFFEKDINQEELVLANHKHFFYTKLTLGQVGKVLQIWFKYLIISFLNLFVKTKYPTNYLYYITANLINAALIAPKKIYVFQPYDTSAYLTAFLLQDKYEVYLSLSNAIIFPFNRYTFLEKTNTIYCYGYQKEEIESYESRKWFKVREKLFWGPEEILEHNTIPKQIPKFDIGIYSTGFWARNGLIRERNVDAVRSYKHINNKQYVRFVEILEMVIILQKKMDISAKIYTHPLERDWFNEYQIKPPYWDKAFDNNIEVDLSEGNSLSKLFEVKMGISTMSTVMLDRWHHGLISLILFDNEKDNGYYHPKYFGNYKDNFYTSLTELEPLITKKLGK